MRTFSVTLLAALMTFATAQFPTGTDPLGAALNPQTTAPVSANTPALAQSGDLLTAISNMLNDQTTPNQNANTNANTNTNNPNDFNTLMRRVMANPFYSYMFMGGDNAKRALMAPYMSRLGPTTGYYFLNGGWDKARQVMMSNMVRNMLTSSTSMDPVMSSVLAGRLTDAPDSYALTQAAMNGQMSRQNNRINPFSWWMAADMAN